MGNSWVWLLKWFQVFQLPLLWEPLGMARVMWQCVCWGCRYNKCGSRGLRDLTKAPERESWCSLGKYWKTPCPTGWELGTSGQLGVHRSSHRHQNREQLGLWNILCITGKCGECVGYGVKGVKLLFLWKDKQQIPYEIVTPGGKFICPTRTQFLPVGHSLFLHNILYWWWLPII